MLPMGYLDWVGLDVGINYTHFEGYGSQIEGWLEIIIG